MSHSPYRRLRLTASALTLLAAAFPLAAAEKASMPLPILASPEQDAAEELALQLLQHPDVKAVQAGLREHLRTTEIGRTPDGAATIERAVNCLTTSLIFKEISTYRRIPHFLWTTEDTPREWRGRTVGCAGTAGDNPDNIYRSAVVQGGVPYEVTGKLDPKTRATQFIVQIGPREPGFAPNLSRAGSEGVEVLKAFSDRELNIAPDGSFRFTIGGASGAPTHVVTPPGPISVGLRTTMSDWKQESPRLSLRRLDAGEPMAFDSDELRRRVVGRMGDYVRGWSEFGTYGFGGLKPNTHSEPTGRAGGWGFVLGLRYKLAEGEAAVVTISRGGAEYLGFQVVDPWTIAADARKNLTSLNLAQATPDEDGNYTFVISPKDPGVANWLDTTGLRDGFGVIRWQRTPVNATGDGLFQGFRIIKLRDAAQLPGIARITPEQRQVQLEKRAAEWANRLR